MDRKGLTLIEMVAAIVAAGIVVGVIALVIVAVHFIGKVW